jgi:hypothetical protein
MGYFIKGVYMKIILLSLLIASITYGSYIKPKPAGSSGNIQYNSSGSFGGSNNLFWDVANNRLGIQNSSPSYKLDIGGTGTSSMRIYTPTANGTSTMEIGQGGTGQRDSYIDLTGDNTYSDYGLRIIRNSAVQSSIEHRGTADFMIKAIDNAAVNIYTNNTLRFVVGQGGALTGISIHNNGGNIASGTYTPSITGSAGCTQIGLVPWIRVGSVVSVALRMSCPNSSLGNTTITVSLPQTTNTGAICSGGLVGGNNGYSYPSGVSTTGTTTGNTCTFNNYSALTGGTQLAGTILYVVQ